MSAVAATPRPHAGSSEGGPSRRLRGRRYKFLDGSQRELWQYSVTEHVRHVAPGSGRGLPGVFFFYEVSPLVAEFVERREGWRALLTGLAAIVGGVHATAALVDRAVGALMERRKGGARLIN